jgi:hypothetical protein
VGGERRETGEESEGNRGQTLQLHGFRQQNARMAAREAASVA